MSTKKYSKLNNLLNSYPSGVVLLSSWLRQRGYSLDLLRRYRDSDWLKSIGNGAMVKKGDEVTYEGAIYALQKQLGLSVHPGGKTALSILGKSHYLEFKKSKVTIFGNGSERLPKWFTDYDWSVKINYYNSSFLPLDVDFQEVEVKSFKIKVSGPTRALMECLYLSPKKQELFECYELMEGLNNLLPNKVQVLLEKCSSIKVKRLFMYMAEKAGHQWVKYIDLNKVDMGQGNRSIIENGVYISDYRITVPKELA